MAQEYAKVLIAQKKDFIAIGRSKKNCEIFCQKFNKPAFAGGLNLFLINNKNTKFKSAIVASNIESLFENTIDLITHGVSKILLEKPGAQNIRDLKKIHSIAKINKVEIYVAYNRRFFGSSIKLKKLLANKDNLSARLEITEFEHLIRNSNASLDTKKIWLLANTSHVLDLAFYLIGNPKSLSANQAGELTWHKHAIFCGSGVTEQNALFTYHGHWGAVGRWGLEIYSKRKKFVLQPLEELKIFTLDSDPKILENTNSYDKDFKPGLYLMLKDFLRPSPKSLPRINEHLKFSKLIYKIASYD
jgi:predicted dehydrogenase